MKKNNYDFYKKLASLYIEREGESLKREFEELNNFEYPKHLDKKINTKIKLIKYKNLLYLIPVAACFIILTLISLPNIKQNIIPSTSEKTIQLISAKLPDNYSLSNIEDDNGKTIFYLENSMKNDVVLTAEPDTESFSKEIFKKIIIKDTTVFYLEKSDYSIVKYSKDNILYTLTSRFNCNDLTDLSKNLL